MTAGSHIGLHLLVKDEEALLRPFFREVRPFVQQMVVVVDDRTTDKSAEIAKEFGAEVYPHTLDLDFAGARNFGLEKITTPWVLWLDADERLSPELQSWLAWFEPGDYDAVAIHRQNFIDNKPIGDHTNEWHVRLFRSHLRVEGRLHERIVVPKDRQKAVPAICMIWHHKTQERQERQNVAYMEWPEQRAIVRDV